ncbi:hypothetical protein [Veillonella rogosae]|uniref:hypothetical protein n=1 Tax=Veillonella rogosae TaxID=423477 RepID=UPI000AADCA8C|nr:hypothetical protein [Veillonella rogosae]
MAKNRVIIKIVTLIAILTYLLLGGPLVVLGNTTEENVTNNIRNNITNSVTNSVESNKDKEPITISVRNGSLRETILGICRSYGISVIGVESLKGNITATVKGESPEEVIKELGRIYHFSVSKQHNTLLIESEEATLENRELYVLSPRTLTSRIFESCNGHRSKE